MMMTISFSSNFRASKEADMRVFIGSQNCNVTSLSANQLTCKPPDSQPPALINGKEDYDELPEVVVLIGEGLQYKIGKLSYSLGTSAFPSSLQNCSKNYKVKYKNIILVLF